MPRMSASWKASVPIAALGTWPVIATIGHRVHVGVGDRRDEVGRARARTSPCRRRPGRWPARSPRPRGRRPARAGPGCAGSWSSRTAGRTAGRIAPPGMPNTVSTPAASSERTRLCAPVICSDIRTLSGLLRGTKNPSARWACEGLRARLSSAGALLDYDEAVHGLTLTASPVACQRREHAVSRSEMSVRPVQNGPIAPRDRRAVIRSPHGAGPPSGRISQRRPSGAGG